MQMCIRFARLLHARAYLLVLRPITYTATTSAAATTTAIAGAVIWHCGRRCEVDVGDGLLVNYFGDVYWTGG